MNRLFISILLFLVCLSICPPAYTQGSNEASKFLDNEVLVAFGLGTSDAEIADYAAEIEGVLIAISPWSRVALIHLENGVSPTEIVATIGGGQGTGMGSSEAADIVISAGLNYAGSIQPFILDADKPQPDFYPEGCSGADVPAETGASMVRVAIIDTGIDCVTNKEESPTDFTLNHIEFENHFGDFLGYDFEDESFIPNDEHGHGTHMAGIIDHIAPSSNIKFMSYKVFDSEGHGSLFDVILALDAAVLNEANIINCSFRFYSGLDNSGAFEHVLDLIEENTNTLVVAGSGNESIKTVNSEGEPYTNFKWPIPALFDNDNILSVASSNCEGGLSSFSNYGGLGVDVVAPGEDVQSFGLGGGYETVSYGTSQATAFITGVAALLASHQDSFDADEVKCAILNSVQISELPVLSQGIVDIQGAYNLLQEGSCVSVASRSSLVKESLLSKPSILLDKGSNMELTMYPNPARDKLTLEVMSKSALEGQIRLYQTGGKKIFEQKRDFNKGFNLFNISLGEIDSGIYILEIDSGSGRLSHKLVVE